MQFLKQDLSAEKLIELYKQLVLPRLIEEKMLVLLRQGKISKWFSGIGQEAIAAGATAALQPDEWIMPLHRNLAVFTGRNMPLSKLFMQWQGNKDGYSKGRERSFHFGSKEHHVCGMISHLGPQLAIADGVALAYKLQKANKVALAFTGDGGTSEGDFHEALNVAAVWDLPVIFVIENNGYGLSTPVNEQYRCISLVDKAKGYGMEGVQIDGNDVKPGFGQHRGCRFPDIDRRRVAVDKDDRRLRRVAEFLIMHAGSVDIYEMRPLRMHDMIGDHIPSHSVRPCQKLHSHRRANRSTHGTANCYR